MNDQIETLKENGYFATIDGAERVQIVGAATLNPEYFYASSEDFHADKRTYYRSVRMSVAVVSFEVGEASLLATKFRDELVKIVAPAGRLLKKHIRPLVRLTDTSLHAIYQTDYAGVALIDPDVPGRRQMVPYGICFTDATNSYAPAAQLSASNGSVPLDGGTWLSDRTPLTVKRDELPTWEGDEISRQIYALVGRFVTVEAVRVCEPYVPPARSTAEPVYGDIDIASDPANWDPMDPRRFIPGADENVRRLRREYLGREPRTGEIIRR